MRAPSGCRCCAMFPLALRLRGASLSRAPLFVPLLLASRCWSPEPKSFGSGSPAGAPQGRLAVCPPAAPFSAQAPVDTRIYVSLTPSAFSSSVVRVPVPCPLLDCFVIIRACVLLRLCRSMRPGACQGEFHSGQLPKLSSLGLQDAWFPPHRHCRWEYRGIGEPPLAFMRGGHAVAYGVLCCPQVRGGRLVSLFP